MSKIGKLPIIIPDSVTVTITDRLVVVKWPKGELSHEVLPCVILKQEEKELLVAVDTLDNAKYWWLTRTLIDNMVQGVTNGYEKKLKVIGVGYDAKVQWKSLALKLGFSHPLDFSIPDGISMEVEKDAKGNPIISIKWIDKQLVGQVAAKIRSYRKPEPYKGKWVRYFDEIVKIKPGKSAA